jgi:large subunit ribosomal protein L10
MPDNVLDVNAVKALAALPGREELLARLLGTMQAPVAQFVRTLNEVTARIALTLAAVRDQKEQAGA